MLPRVAVLCALFLPTSALANSVGVLPVECSSKKVSARIQKAVGDGLRGSGVEVVGPSAFAGIESSELARVQSAAAEAGVSLVIATTVRKVSGRWQAELRFMDAASTELKEEWKLRSKSSRRLAAAMKKGVGSKLRPLISGPSNRRTLTVLKSKGIRSRDIERALNSLPYFQMMPLRVASKLAPGCNLGS